VIERIKMITFAEADIIIGILCNIFALGMLGAFTGAIFIEKHRRTFAIISGVMSALVLIIMVLALAAPYLVPV
jgi:hypothetical protein